MVHRIIKQEKLIIRRKHRRKYNSYKGCGRECINKDFHAIKPNEKWLTDITEFSIKAGKVYLSPIVDYFDGLLVTWSISTSPDTLLVNSMLDDAAKLISTEEKPIIHLNKGVHYHWPGWLNRMGKMVSYDQGQRKIVHLIILPARGYWKELRMRCSITPIGRGGG